MRPSKKRQILAAAAEIVRHDGASALTLEASAVRAGVSKGGLLYHFPSKTELLRSLIHTLIEEFEALQSVHIARDSNKKNMWLRAYVSASAEFSDSNELAFGLIAAVAEDPNLLEPLGQRYELWDLAMASEGADPIMSYIIRLAVDGMWFGSVMKLGEPPIELRPAIIERLLEMCDGKK